MVTLAQGFHYELGSYYHSNSYVHYGSDDDYRSFRQVTWELTGGFIASQIQGRPGTKVLPPDPKQASTLRLTADNHEGRVWLVNDHSEKQ